MKEINHFRKTNPARNPARNFQKKYSCEGLRKRVIDPLRLDLVAVIQRVTVYRIEHGLRVPAAALHDVRSRHALRVHIRGGVVPEVVEAAVRQPVRTGTCCA